MKTLRKFCRLWALFFAFPVVAQDVDRYVANTRDHYFLIDEKSDQPRFDVVVKRFTPYEKSAVSKHAVMDTLTKPVVTRVAETEYHISAGRMAEPLTFVIRDSRKLEKGYEIRYWFDTGEDTPWSATSYFYELKGELCRLAVKNIPFGIRTMTLQLWDVHKQLQYQLLVTYSYPEPKLYYIDIKPGYGIPDGRIDTTWLRKHLRKVNQVETVYAEDEGGVPGRVVVGGVELYFGFKPAYFDGVMQKTSINCRIDSTLWRGTPLETNPVTHFYYHLRKEWDLLSNGGHTLSARYGGADSPALVVPFEIRRHWAQSAVFYTGIIAKAALMTVALNKWVLFVLGGLLAYAAVRRRFRKEGEKAQKTQLELRAIQAQLNPHFIFNALGSIQGLINNDAIEKANTYLTNFSNLLRSSLNQKEWIPLSAELDVLGNYIQLEQLRFNFRYELAVDKAIGAGNVEVPSLLIQPLVENAIRHGIAGLGERGKLMIEIRKEASDLRIVIADNGKGFRPEQAPPGHGIQLTRERIAILNKRKKFITLTHISEPGKGCRAEINLKGVC